MGYRFQALPPDLLDGDVPRPAADDGQCRGGERLGSLFLSTMLAVPSFRRTILGEAGLAGLDGRVEVFHHARFRGEPEGGRIAPPDGLIRQAMKSRGPAALIDIAASTFESQDDVKRIADHLALARERRIPRLITLSNTVPDQAFLAAVKAQFEMPGPDRLRSLTWMETVDCALHLLERREVDGQVGTFLLEHYVRTIKDEVVREAQARASRAQGALYFASLGRDWDSFMADVERAGAIDPKDPRLAAVAANWLAFLRALSLYLTRANQRDEDVLLFPNVKPARFKQRKDVVLKRLKSSGQLLATFQKRGEAAPVVLCVDLKHQEVVFQIQLDGPDAKAENGSAIQDLADAISEEMTLGKTQIKIFWPTEKTPRKVTRAQAIKEPISIAPPQHGLVPDKFIVERTVPVEKIIAEPESFVQLVALELRGFRAAMRHLLHPRPAT